MTNGTSQGLYVIVAVVIFGIFVGISYLIFQDSLRPKLMKVFEQSTQEALKNTKIFNLMKFSPAYYSNVVENKDNTYSVKSNGLIGSWGDDTPVGIRNNNDPRILIAFGETLEIRFEVMPTKDTYAIVDYNAEQLAGQEPFSTGGTINDMYGDNDSNINRSKKKTAVKKDVWSEFSFKYTNNHENNVNKYTLKDISYFGIVKSYFDTEDSYKIRNIGYKIY